MEGLDFLKNMMTIAAGAKNDSYGQLLEEFHNHEDEKSATQRVRIP